MRTLRSSIHMSDVDQPPKVIHVTSARPDEGKTTIAVSLAISAASSGLKVVLVDADLRHPSTSRFFKLEQERGLVDLLTGAATSDSLLRFYKDLNLRLLPAGSKSLNPPDVLGSERMKDADFSAEGYLRLRGAGHAAGRSGCRCHYRGESG